MYYSISELENAINELTKKTKSEDIQKEIDNKTTELNNKKNEYNKIASESSNLENDKNILLLDNEISTLKELIKKLNNELIAVKQASLVLGEDFFAYVEFDMVLKLFASKELEKFNRSISARSSV